MSNSSTHIKRKRLILLVLGGVVIVAVACSAVLIIKHRSTPNKSTVIPSSSSTTNSSANNSNKTDKPSSTGGGSSSGNSSNTPNANSVNTLPLSTPWGNFISNHTPGANGSPTQEQSICNTTPGASCYMQFTNTQSGEVKVLSTQVADSSGSTSWTWDVKQAGFSSGTWKIAAIATLNGQTKTAQDTRDLVVQ